MQTTGLFDQALDSIEKLEPDAQSELIEIVKRRVAERERERLIKDVEEALKEFEEGKMQILNR